MHSQTYKLSTFQKLPTFVDAEQKVANLKKSSSSIPISNLTTMLLYRVQAYPQDFGLRVVTYWQPGGCKLIHS